MSDAPDDGTHPTADTLLLIFSKVSGRRVMAGVQRLFLMEVV
jgi:hypothetical protein